MFIDWGKEDYREGNVSAGKRGEWANHPLLVCEVLFILPRPENPSSLLKEPDAKDKHVALHIVTVFVDRAL